MTDDLKRLRQLRPQVSPPTPAARRAALEQLQSAIISGGGSPDPGSGEPLSHVLPGADAGANGARDAAPVIGPERARRRWWRAGSGVVAVSLALATAVVIAVGAIALLGHARHRPVSPAASSHQRGEILDQSGRVLADTKVTTAIEIDPARLPHGSAARLAVYRRLAGMLGLTTRPERCRLAAGHVVRLAPIPCAVAQSPASQAASVVIAPSVSPAIGARVRHSSARLPGVVVASRRVRAYPQGDLAAQALGTVEPIRPGQRVRGTTIAGRTITGRSGLEWEYDQFLSAGDNVRLNLDANLQRVGQRALAHSISANAAAGGAFVAMNPDTGAVYALGSLPSFDPTSLATGDASQATLNHQTSPQSGDPLLNRAIQSAGPPGSTFAPITATAGLQSGAWSPNRTYDDSGAFCIPGQCRHNSGHAAYGSVNLRTALQVADADFFYKLGALTNTPDPPLHPGGGPLDQWAHAFGIGRPTGIDLPGEVAGTLPAPGWRAQRNRLEADCDTATGRFTGQRKHPPGGCGFADGTNRPWSVGDNINLAVGQGDVQVTPLQLAVAYAAIANGGTILRPHLGATIQGQTGTVLQNIAPSRARHLTINPIDLQTIRAGLRAAAAQPGGTSTPVFGHFGQQVYAATGTAQSIGARTGTLQDDAWFAGFVPASATTKPIVVVVTVQRGGFGAVAAAPVARELLSQWFENRPGPYRAGSSTTL